MNSLATGSTAGTMHNGTIPHSIGSGSTSSPGDEEYSEIHAFASGGGSMCLEHTVPGDISNYPFEVIRESTDYLMSKTKHRPKIAIICGSGLDGLPEHLTDADTFPYETIPHFPKNSSMGPGHFHCRMVFGLLSGVPVMCMLGRFHAYEGYPVWRVALPVRIMKLIGVETMIVSNAAGGINPSFKVGDVMFIKDHINMQGFGGDNPLRGKNDERFGPRFPAMNNAYDRDLRKVASKVAEDMNLSVREGVYVMIGGPTFESVAELKMLQLVGVDAVGMSTVPEVVVARHCGIKVFAFSLITNLCITDYEDEGEPSPEEVNGVANSRKRDLDRLTCNIVKTFSEL